MGQLKHNWDLAGPGNPTHIYPEHPVMAQLFTETDAGATYHNYYPAIG